MRGKVFDTTTTVTVLCEHRTEIDPSKVPPELISSAEGVKWTIMIAKPQTDHAANSSEKLVQFPQEKEKTVEDIPTVNPSGCKWSSTPGSIIRTVGEVLRQSPKSTESYNYYGMRTFSGINPTPLGEENLDSWLDQAR